MNPKGAKVKYADLGKSAKPTQPPSGADFSQLTKKVNETAAKVGVAPLSSTVTGRIPAWKRWTGGEGPDFDGTGLRDVVNADAIYLDAVKEHLDTVDARETAHNNSQDARLDRLEAAQSFSPFPASG
jgi:hypothetical protein